MASGWLTKRYSCGTRSGGTIGGGQAQPISVVSTENWDRKTPAWEGERQLAPVWMGGLVYYLSERDWASNIWSYDPRTGRDRQLTRHADFDVKSLGAGDGVLIYEQAGYLHELNPSSGQTRQLEIHIARDLNWARNRWEEIPFNRLRDARLSPTGKRALFESRGDLFTVPVEEGSWRNITGSSAVADRHPSGPPTARESPGSTMTEQNTAWSSPIRTGPTSAELKSPTPPSSSLPSGRPTGSDWHSTILIIDSS